MWRQVEQFDVVLGEGEEVGAGGDGERASEGLDVTAALDVGGLGGGLLLDLHSLLAFNLFDEMSQRREGERSEWYPYQTLLQSDRIPLCRQTNKISIKITKHSKLHLPNRPLHALAELIWTKQKRPG